ncbi:MAG: glutamate synthase large subunit [Candidatus Sumerlaeia bacterium]
MTFNHSFQRCNAAGWPTPQGLYDPQFEHDSCGVGFVARLDNEPYHYIINNGVTILKNLQHRGAVGSDKATGDGAGLLIQIPNEFFQHECPQLGIKLPDRGQYAVASVFLPQDPDTAAQCRRTFERFAEAEGTEPLGWRIVPLETAALGELARRSLPRIEQFFVARGAIAPADFERKLYVIRRQVEKEIAGWTHTDASQFYVPSFSSRTLCYKGLMSGSQLDTFYPDITDKRVKSSFAIVHERYSTNTLPRWCLAQPFRFLAHNGEINTLRGNINRMKAREALMKSDVFGDDLEKIKPIIIESGSDSAIMDNVLEALVHGGRSLPHVMMMMVPEAWTPKYHMSRDKRAFYEYHSALMEPWDGPAALVVTDGRYIGACLDRNGLRPARYTVTTDGLVVMASETGVLEIPGDKILRRGRLQPGKMFLVDLDQNRIVPDNEIKAKISRQRPYRRWLNDNKITLRGLLTPPRIPPEDPDVLLRRQHAFGYTEEELNVLLSPMASNGQEPVGSMGNDAALAVLSNRPQLLFNYFKQLFAQVTNPPIDPLREELVMTLRMFIGRARNIFDETPEHCRLLELQHPILGPQDIERLRKADHPDLKVCELDMLFPRGGGGAGLERALNELFDKAGQAVNGGATVLILTDRHVDAGHVPIPVLLAVSGLHHYLIRNGLRTQTALVVETGEAREVMHFAMLIAYGASAVCPTLAYSTIRDLAVQKLLEKDLSPDAAIDNYINAVKKGLLKAFSRMGISTMRSFFGSQIFEAVGIGRQVIDKYFTGTVSRVGGIGLEEIAREAAMRHERAFPHRGQPPRLLDMGGAYHVRVGGEPHLFSPQAVYKLQQAVRTGEYEVFKEYTQIVDRQSEGKCTLRSLFRFKNRTPIPIEEVEPVEAIFPRFASAAMSFGSISKEAHETLAIAMNRLGARSNSGEGGEDPERYKIAPNGDSRRSKIKQIASGRFGVTAEYCLNADELQIKIAQGAKPGEGGQLPGHKVSVAIARVRHTTPGVTLISPPPHHDIYSIEDIAQLIYDLKMINPAAKVSVKLVSAVGVGTVAAGVAKAKADLVTIAGYDGGTGASPWSSIKHAGLPWELGLAETQQTLIANGLRDRIRVQVDGQLKTGRDLAIAALMGAEEFGFGTTVLVAMGCILMRKCHLNTCPVGVATQNKLLRDRFAGRPEHVVNFFRFLAQELREYMAALGFRTLDEMIGRTDLLEAEPAPDHWKTSGLDFSALLAPPPANGHPLRCVRAQEHTWKQALDQKLIKLARAAIDRGEPVRIELPIRNVNRTVGATLSGEVVKKWGPQGLPEDTIFLYFKGSAGQSLGAFLTRGITLLVEGDVNDYMGKSLSGGKIIVVPPRNAKFHPHENVIAGNVILYGATAGEVYINGIAGERFAVRNSGARAVVEGVGDHGCEYMTGGTVVVLGPTGNNFAAGMSGGVAYVYDESQLFDTRCNLDMVDLESVWTDEDRGELRTLIENHFRYTHSLRARLILENWEAHLPLFVKVMPMDYKKALGRMRLAEDVDEETISATEEVFR